MGMFVREEMFADVSGEVSVGFTNITSTTACTLVLFLSQCNTELRNQSALFANNLDVKFVVTPCKIRSWFGVKGAIPTD